MLDISCDSQNIKEILQVLERLMRHGGAQFHPQMRVIEEGGDIHIEMPRREQAAAQVMSFPTKLLPPMDKFVFRYDNGKLKVAPNEDIEDINQKYTMELLVKLYNECDKLEHFAKVTPWCTLSEFPDLFDFMYFDSGLGNENYLPYQYKKDGEYQKMLIDRFFGSRYLRLDVGRNADDKELIENTMADDTGESSLVLLSFIDLLNNHVWAPGFAVQNTDIGKKMVIRSFQPYADSLQCFVRYGSYDSLATYLSYAYVDERMPILNSVRNKVHLPEGLTLNILGHQASTIVKENVDENLRDILHFLPKVDQSEEGTITIPSIPIGNQNTPYLFRRILKWIFQRARPGLEGPQMSTFIREAESQIIESNRAYYKKLAQKSRECRDRAVKENRDTTPLDTVDRLAREQIERLDSYVELHK